MLTLKQANIVMARGIPVTFRGMSYLRIISVSRVLSRHNEVIPSIAMEDRSRRTVYHGSPDEVTMHGDIDGTFYYFEGDELKSAVVSDEG